jgi:hypothetical protein
LEGIVGSINFEGFGLEEAAWMSPRIGVGKVLEIGAYRYPGSRKVQPQKEGASLRFYRVAVLRMLRGRGLTPGN